MGKLLLLILIIAAVVLVWQAFKPRPKPSQPPAIKGPDDDEDFLWQIDKERFKERRRREQNEGESGSGEPPASP